jgi:hypothetical protein
MGDLAAPVHEHAHLASGLAGERAQLSCELLGHQALRRQAALCEALELTDLAGLEAVRVAGDVDLGTPPTASGPVAMGEI